MIRLLVVEDDKKINELVSSYLVRAGYAVTDCLTAEQALAAMETQRFDMILSDIMMPGMDGFEFAESVRAADANIPILFMTARDDLSAKRRGYQIGIDDYLVKPFSLDELLLRVGALLRRARIAQRKKIEVGNFVMDQEEHTAYRDGEEVALTVREFDLLYKLLSFPKKTFSRAQLMEEFWGFDSAATLRTIDVYIVKIREKTAGCTGFELVTVHGLGYKAILK